MENYYSSSLNSGNLQKCYEVAPERVKQFLEEEILFVLSRTKQNDTVLDLGCGYGRVSLRLAKKVKKVTGVDISGDNIKLAKTIGKKIKNCEFLTMDASRLTFPDDSFDMVICIQNGISAFKVNPKELIAESIRVTKSGGRILYSSYSEKFWEHRLEWFKIQSEYGLIGEIDYSKTKDGEIICKDGFRATTYSGQQFLEIASSFNVETEIFEVDKSSIFCEMIVK